LGSHDCQLVPNDFQRLAKISAPGSPYSSAKYCMVRYCKRLVKPWIVNWSLPESYKTIGAQLHIIVDSYNISPGEMMLSAMAIIPGYSIPRAAVGVDDYQVQYRGMEHTAC
jgi:hypothetical protein